MDREGFDTTIAAISGVIPHKRPKGWDYKRHVLYAVVRAIIRRRLVVHIV